TASLNSPGPSLPPGLPGPTWSVRLYRGGGPWRWHPPCATASSKCPAQSTRAERAAHRRRGLPAPLLSPRRRALLQSTSEHFATDEARQGVGQLDGPIGALVVLHQGCDGAREGQRAAVERVHDLRAPLAGGAAGARAGLEPRRLE